MNLFEDEVSSDELEIELGFELPHRESFAGAGRRSDAGCVLMAVDSALRNIIALLKKLNELDE